MKCGPTPERSSPAMSGRPVGRIGKNAGKLLKRKPGQAPRPYPPVNSLPTSQFGTTAVQQLAPNFCLTCSDNLSAAALLLASAKVVEPLPDINVTAAPCSFRNS